MSRYIDADALQIDFDNMHGGCFSDHVKSFVRYTILAQPTADVVAVVRCKECDWLITNELKKDGTTDKRYKPTWCTLHNEYMNDDDFCSYGERKEK